TQERWIKHIQVVQREGLTYCDSGAGGCPVYSIDAPQYNHIVLCDLRPGSDCTCVTPTWLNSCKVAEGDILVPASARELKVSASANKCVPGSASVIRACRR